MTNSFIVGKFVPFAKINSDMHPVVLIIISTLIDLCINMAVCSCLAYNVAAMY